MKLTYDPEVDALYLQLRDALPADSVDFDEGVTADLDAEGQLIGIEILDASERLDAAAIAALATAQRAATAA